MAWDSITGSDIMANGGSTYIERFQYTLDDLITVTNLAAFQSFINTNAVHPVTFDAKFENVLQIIHNERYNGCIDFVDVTVVPGEETVKPDADNAVKKRFASRFAAIYSQSQDKYLALLGFYEAKKAHLLDQLSATQTTNNGLTHRVNDTPQNGGEWTDDNHTSTYDKTDTTGNSTTTSDPTTIMARLSEVQDQYANLEGD